MLNIESLKDYIGVISKEELIKLATKIYVVTDFINKDYKEYRNWYFNKQLPGTLNGNNRNILFVRNIENEIVGVACLKRDEEEQKICTLYVSDECRDLGIGESLLEESMNWLGTTKPLITLADYKLEMFKPFIIKYDWKLTEIIDGLYNDKSQELCFNGYINKTIKKVK